MCVLVVSDWGVFESCSRKSAFSFDGVDKAEQNPACCVIIRAVCCKVFRNFFEIAVSFGEAGQDAADFGGGVNVSAAVAT